MSADLDLHTARQALAAAASTPDVPCLPYTPDNPSPPIAFIDALTVDYGTPMTFGAPATCRAVIVACRQRHDRVAATAALEADIGPVRAALEQAVEGLSVGAVTSGTAEIGKTELPAVSYALTFPLPCHTT